MQVDNEHLSIRRLEVGALRALVQACCGEEKKINKEEGNWDLCTFIQDMNRIYLSKLRGDYKI